MADLIEARRRQRQAGRKGAGAVAQFDNRIDLVDREKVFDPVAQPGADIAGVIGKGFCGVGGFPAADVVLQRLRQIPVVERREWLDIVGEQFVGEAVVESEALALG